MSMEKQRSFRMTKIREQREFFKLTQSYVALYCGVSLGAYQQWERGLSKPTPPRRLKLIELLELPKDYFKEV